MNLINNHAFCHVSLFKNYPHRIAVFFCNVLFMYFINLVVIMLHVAENKKGAEYLKFT